MEIWKDRHDGGSSRFSNFYEKSLKTEKSNYFFLEPTL